MAIKTSSATTGSAVGQVQTQTPEVPIPAHKPDGPLAAVLIGSGIGTFVLGLLVTLAAWKTGVKDALQLDDGVGPLSGKTIYASLAFLVSWVVLTPLLAKRDGLLRPAVIVFLILTVMGFIGTFPTFFEAFEP